MKAASEVARFVKETSWGTDPGAGYTTLLLEGAGLKPSEDNNWVDVNANSSYPAPTTKEPVKKAYGLTLETILHPGSIQALLEIAWKRGTVAGAPNEIDSFTFQKKDAYAGNAYLGCKAKSAKLAWSANDLLKLTIEMVAKSRVPQGGIVAGAYPTGQAYKGAMVGLSINAVAALGVESGEISVENNLTEGPVNGSGLQISYLDSGLCVVTGSVKAKYASAAWDALAQTLTGTGLTTFPGVLTFGGFSGGVAKDAILTFGAGSLVAKKNTHEYSKQDDTVTQTFEIHNIGTLPAWTYPA